MSIEQYPLQWPQGWPRSKNPIRAKFQVTFGRARDNVFRELALMKATNVVMSTNVIISQRTKLPYADQAQPADKGVVVYFTLFGKQQCIPCDRWDKVDHNMQAVAKTVEALRGIERWGAKEMVTAAFSGLVALPAPDEIKTKPAMRYFDDCIDADHAKGRWNRLVKEMHPDVGGDGHEFTEMQKQYEEFKR